MLSWWDYRIDLLCISCVSLECVVLFKLIDQLHGLFYADAFVWFGRVCVLSEVCIIVITHKCA